MELASPQLIASPSRHNFRDLDIFPNASDLAKDETPYLRPNIPRGPFKNVEHYLDVQFRLMREDLIRPLREDITRAKKALSLKSNPRKLRIFRNVKITCHRVRTRFETVVRLDPKDVKGVNWEACKWLKGGSLLCFSNDNFETFFLATILWHSEQEGKEHLVEIKLENPSDSLLIWGLYQSFTMIEASSYFEAYRHVLTEMKQLTTTLFPFQRYIVKAIQDKKSPSYLKEISSVDFTPLVNKPNFKNIEVKDLKSWPTEADLNFDKGQYKAFCSAITEEFCLIQGPPGTGKTFIGKTIVKFMLHNNFPRPIIITSFTNHALDQFLEHLSTFTDKIVRIGGGSLNKNIEKYELKRLKDKQHNRIEKSLAKKGYYGKYAIYEDHLKALKKKIKILKKDLNSIFQSIIPYQTLKDFIDPPFIEHFEGNNNSISKWLNKPSKKQILQKMLGKDIKSMPSNSECIINLSVDDRWKFYAVWVHNYTAIKSAQLKILILELEATIEDFHTYKQEESRILLKEMDVIGLTTTGAAKYKTLIDHTNAKIVIIEEAAEILESHTLTSLPQSSKHLILIGDHQQLKPRPSTHALAKDFKMDISLFERMMNNKLNYSMLTTQHRMRPFIADLLVPHFYTGLKNSNSVKKYESIRGISKNVIFVEHNKPELFGAVSTSYANYFEMSYLIELYLYLLHQGYKSSQITLLVTYTNQKEVFEKEMASLKLPQLEELQVVTVDSYQGEENDIILISFVRSSEGSKIGFLSISNRICVALSRAKKGLYCIGNFGSFESKTKFWKTILKKLRSTGSLLPYLPLCCEKHPNSIVKVSEPKDFSKTCEAICNAELECGHRCPWPCHLEDHTHFKCTQPCHRTLCKRNHQCPRKCFETCICCLACNKEALFLNASTTHLAIMVPC